jgi:hypothetical protein
VAELSPQAQAVEIAYQRAPRPFPFNAVQYDRNSMAAALRAVAKLDGIKPEPLGPCVEWYGDPLRTESISQQDFRYTLAKEKKRVQVAAQRQLLAIAAELEDAGNHPAKPDSSPAPAGGLVERVAGIIVNGQACDYDEERTACAAILAVAEWLDTRGQHGCSLWLREEVEP